MSPRTTQPMYTRQEFGKKIDLGNKAHRKERERENPKPKLQALNPKL